MIINSITLLLLATATAALASSTGGHVFEKNTEWESLDVPLTSFSDIKPFIPKATHKFYLATYTNPVSPISHTVVLKCERACWAGTLGFGLCDEFRLHHYAYTLSPDDVLPVYNSSHYNKRSTEMWCFSMASTPNRDAFSLMVNADSPMPEPLVKVLVYRMARALALFHGKMFVHRDVKPHNIVLMVDGAFKLMDFGHAARLDDPSHAARLQLAFGTKEYRAPEYNNQPFPSDQRPADVYSLAATILDLLLFLRKRYEPGWFHSKVSQIAYNLIENMTRKDPDQRYTMQQVLNHPWLKAAADNVKDNNNAMADMKKVADADGYPWDKVKAWLQAAGAVVPQVA